MFFFVDIMYMPTRKKSRKSRSNKRHRRHSKAYFKGGNCAMCGSCMQNAHSQSLFRGGQYCKGRQRGGNDNPPSFQGLPIRYYYGQNTHINDPLDPVNQVASRQLANIIGGKNKTMKAKRGGSSLMIPSLAGQYSSPSAFNPVNSVGDIETSLIPSNILSGKVDPISLPNPSVFNQPATLKYNMYNLPIA
jgi:hypothetical protein